MKTPREILQQRHQAMESKLNAVRHRAVATIGRPARQSWIEFLVSLRWHLVGLSAVWGLVLFLNTNASSDPVVTMAQDKTLPTPVLWAAMRENRRELIELTDTPAPPAPAALPPRRGEIQFAMRIV